MTNCAWLPQYSTVDLVCGIISSMRGCRVNLPNRCYHLISRVAHRAFFLDDEGRTRLVDLIRRVSRFSGVKLLAYGVMSNHFHVTDPDPDHPNSPRQKYALAKEGEERIRRLAPL